jgi:hypothetical protein
VFNIPTWISNVLFLITIYLAGFQHVQLRRRNSVMNLQFMMIVFALVMMVLGALYSHVNPWLSLAFFVLAVTSLGVTYRQFRTLPPMRSIE